MVRTVLVSAICLSKTVADPLSPLMFRSNLSQGLNERGLDPLL